MAANISGPYADQTLLIYERLVACLSLQRPYIIGTTDQDLRVADQKLCAYRDLRNQADIMRFSEENNLFLLSLPSFRPTFATYLSFCRAQVSHKLRLLCNGGAIW